MATKDSTKSTLELSFETNTINSSGAYKTATLSIINPRENLTKAEVESVANTIISKNIFCPSGGELVKIKDYYYRLVETKVLA